MTKSHDTVIDPPGGSLILRGFVEGDVAALFIEQLAALSPADAPMRLELEQATIEDTAVAALLAEHIRLTAQRIGALEVIGAPEAIMLALERLDR